MSDKQRKPRTKNSAPVKMRYIVGHLKCQRCANQWFVVDLNEHRKAVQCPICAEYNSITEAIKRAA